MHHNHLTTWCTFAQYLTQVSPANGGGVTLETKGGVVYGLPIKGVRVTQVEAKMRSMFYDLPAWWPGNLESDLVGMMARISVKLRRYPPKGISIGRSSIESEKAVYNRKEYRLDIDNLRGHNLKFY